MGGGLSKGNTTVPSNAGEEDKKNNTDSDKPKSCCPPNAERYLAPDYKAVGKTMESEGTEFYSSSEDFSTKKAVIVIPDIFGWNGGRTRNIADYFAEKGYYTVVPKLLTPPVNGGTDGDGLSSLNDFSFDIFKERFTWDILRPKMEALTKFLKSNGIEKIYLLAFCWGGWLGQHLIADSGSEEDYVCLAVGHPSNQIEEFCFGNSNQDFFDRVKKPVLFLPAKGDPDGYRERGAWFSSIKSRFPTSQTLDFPNQEHGFIPRADISVAENKAAVDLALETIVSFFALHSSS